MVSKQLLFVFGRTPELAFLELQVLFPGSKRYGTGMATLSAGSNIDPDHCMNILGGTVKIAQVIGYTSVLKPPEIAQFLVHDKDSVDFGISVYGSEDAPHSLSAQIKHELAEKGIHARYIQPKRGGTLSSVSVRTSHMTELVIVHNEDGFIVAKTLAVQAYDAWNTRVCCRPRLPG
jgi:hypothetical protein